MSFPVVLAGFVAVFAVFVTAEDPSFDHQTKTYDSKFEVVTASSGGELTATPYFSPDHSTEMQVWLLGNATKSIDLSIPGWDAWTECSSSTSCTGCTPTETRDDEFPLFAVLLNAVHNGITVRILTNDYGIPDCTGSISPLSFLVLNGAGVRFYTTTSFDHQKYINVDGKRVSISSVNFSKSSYMYNREAGVIYNGSTTIIADFTTKVFDK